MKDYYDNTNADIRLLGMPSILNPGSQFVSASRAAMFSHHLTQAMALKNPEMNKLFTGEEHKFIPYEIDKSNRDHDCEILDVIPKYEPTLLKGGNESCPEIYVITQTLEPGGVKRLDYFVVKKYLMGVNGFGHIPILETRNPRRVGDVLYKDDPITHSPVVKGNQWCLGTNLNTVMGSFPETIEDAFIISESGAKKLECDQISQIVIDVRQDRRPLNLNGDDNINKLLPDIGGYVREDGILCGWRPSHWTTVVADADPKALQQITPYQDDLYRIPPGSKILDVDYNTSKHRLHDCYEQAQQYIASNSKCWDKIYDTYLRYRSTMELTDKMWKLVFTALKRKLVQNERVATLDDSVLRSLKHMELYGQGNRQIEFMQIVVTYTVPRKVVPGSKLTGISGSKGVVGAVYKDEWMPVDEQGIRADLWVDMTSPVARNNPDQLYEMGINRISEFVRRKIKEIYDAGDYMLAFETLLDWCNDVNENYALQIRESIVDNIHKKGFVEEMIRDGIRLWIPPFLNNLTPSDDDFWNALENIKRWQVKWECVSSPITFSTMQRDGVVKQFTTEANFAIGSKYILHLNKLPDVTAPGPAAVNHMEIPTKNTFENKHFPVSTSPNRFGEDELRMMALDSPIREVTRFQALNANSPTGVRAVIHALFTEEDPSNIGRIAMTNAQLIQSNVVLNLFHNTTAVLGIETKNTKIDPFDVPEELATAIASADNLDYDDDRERKAVRKPGSKKTAATKKRDKLRDFFQISEDDSDTPTDREAMDEEAPMVLEELDDLEVAELDTVGEDGDDD